MSHTFFFQHILTALNIPFTKSYANELQKRCCDDGSIIKLAGLLSIYNIDYQALKFNDKNRIIHELPAICIVDHKICLALTSGTDSLTLMYNNGETVTMRNDVFIDLWDGKALVLTIYDNSSEPDYAHHRRTEILTLARSSITIISTLLTLLWGLWSSPLLYSPSWWIILLSGIAGITLSLSAIRTKLGLENRLTDRLCRFSRSMDCSGIIQSSGGEILGISLGVIGTGYFLATTLTMLYIPSLTPELALISLCALPFTLWSVWYQRSKAKRWCVVCIFILSILWLQALSYIFGADGFFLPIALSHLALTSALIGLAIAGVHSISSLVAKKFIGERYRMQFYDLKFDGTLMDCEIRLLPTDDVPADEYSTLLFGDSDARFNLTLLSNPYCTPCKHLHDKLKHFPWHTTNLRLLLTDFDDDQSIISRYIIASYQQLGAKKSWAIISKWYSYGITIGPTFFNDYQLDPYKSEVTIELGRHRNWITVSHPSGTPTLIIDGTEILWPYNLIDYPFLSNELRNV